MVSERIAGEFLPCHGYGIPARECAVVGAGGGACAQSELTPRRPSFRGGMPGAMALSIGIGWCLVALIAANRSGARHPLTYVILGVGLWLAFLQSGIHATVAGVLLAITIPARHRSTPSSDPRQSRCNRASSRSIAPDHRFRSQYPGSAAAEDDGD